jgi:xylulose-5-phosphate/fructose-6-phosphate phosphoketolase
VSCRSEFPTTANSNSKTPGPTYLSPEEATAHCRAGISIWKKFSTDEGRDPDVVLVGAGVEVTSEIIAAASILRKEAPEIRVRVVNLIGESPGRL